MGKRIIIHDYIENDPLSENNLNKTFDLVNGFRLSSPHKSIWLYSGYTFEEIVHPTLKCNQSRVRKIILSGIDVLIDGKYIDSQRDISLAYRGSKNQRLIDIYQSLRKGEIVLWELKNN